MRVIIDDEIFCNVLTQSLDRLTLFRMGFEGRHALQLDPMDGPAFHRWLARLDRPTQDECLWAIEAGVEKESREPAAWTIRVANVTQPEWNGSPPRLPLGYAVEYLNRPLKLLVENGLHDGAFLMAVSGMYRAHLVQMIEDKRWIQFEHGGGLPSMLEWVEKRVNQPSEIRHIWVMFDSDALCPNSPSKASKALDKLCERRKVPRHQLTRRAIENYLPREAIARWAELGTKTEVRRRRKLCTAYFRLESDEKRHHFNMKDGFTGDEKRDDFDKSQALYKHMPDDLRQALQAGFGRKIASCFEQEIPEHWLVADGQTVETSKMVRALLALL